MNFTAVILAGGSSTRMGRDKATLVFRGRPLIQRQIETVRACNPAAVYISARSKGDYAELGCEVLADNFPGCGPLAGIERALEAMDSPLLLVLAVDLPRLTPRTLLRLVGLSGYRTGVVPVVAGQPQPLAACYPKSTHAAVREFLGNGWKAATRFVNLCASLRLVRFHEIPESRHLEFLNWNRPGDLAGSAARS